jgi:CspA family cold shock protein
MIVQLLVGVTAALLAAAATLQFQLHETPALLVVVITCACLLGPLAGMLPRRTRGGSESASDREEGEIKWFNASKGFGFIRRQNGEEIFVHFRSVQGDIRDRRQLKDGQRVSFLVARSEKGLQAEDVVPLRD